MIQLSLLDQPHAPEQVNEFVARDYQQRGIDAAFRAWDEGSPGALFRQPTGSGKTVSGALIAQRWLRQGEEYRVLVLAHERQLIQQFADEIRDILGSQPAIEMADQHCSGRERLIVASRATLASESRLAKFDPRLHWLLIIDEAHRWARKLPSCAPIIEHFESNSESRRLGLTATPERGDKTTLGGLFPSIANDYRLFDVDGGPCAVNDGWAVPYDQRFITVEGVDFKNIREVAKDFDSGELEKILGESEVLAKLCQPLVEVVGDRRTIIFSPGTAMARDVALYLNAKAGQEVALTVDGSFPDDLRKLIYARHQRGEVQFLSVCGLCREGYNDPGIEAVAVFRPTKSRPLAEQMKGRGCRPLKGLVDHTMTADERRAAIAASRKPACLIVDLVGVTGIADCASTASIMADSKPDEVIERANANMLAKSEEGEACDVAEEIRQAERQIAAEREQAKREREARQRAEQEEMNRRAKLQADVRYQQRQVGSGAGGRVKTQATAGDMATEGQLKYLRVLGMREDWSHLTKRQAGRMIDQLKNQGLAPDHVARMSPRASELPPERGKRTLDIDEINKLLMEAGR